MYTRYYRTYALASNSYIQNKRKQSVDIGKHLSKLVKTNPLYESKTGTSAACPDRAKEKGKSRSNGRHIIISPSS